MKEKRDQWSQTQFKWQRLWSYSINNNNNHQEAEKSVKPIEVKLIKSIEFQKKKIIEIWSWHHWKYNTV